MAINCLQPQQIDGNGEGIQRYFSPDSFELLTSIMYPKRAKKGTTLMWEGEPAEHWYYIRKGRVKLTKSSDSGSSLTLSLHHAGDLIGEADVLADSVHSFQAEVIEDAELGVIQRKDLELLLWQHRELTVEFTRWLGLQHRLAQSKFRDLMMFGKPGALCSLLIRLSNSYGEPYGTNGHIRIGIKLNNTELAELIGATRESVNRMLSEMKKEDVLDMANGHIVIKNLAYLRGVCHCEHCPKDICRV